MQFIRNLKHIFFAFLIVFVAIFGVLRFFGDVLVTSTNHALIYREGNKALDLLYPYHFQPSRDIAILQIDNDTINSLQAGTNLKMLGIPKSVYIEVIEKLQSVGVKGIAFDIVFQNPDPSEAEFARILENSPNIVIARMSEAGKCTPDMDGIYVNCEGLPRSVYTDVKQGLIEIDSGGDKRYVSRTLSGAIVDTLTLALYETTLGNEPTPYPLDEKVLMPYFGPGGSYSSMSLSRFLTLPKVELVSNFAGKYIFIGESGTLIHDAHISPVDGELMDGVETHAHFLDGILQKRYMSSWSISDPRFFSLVLGLLLVMVALYMYLPKYGSLALAFLMVVWIVWMARYGYFRYGIVMDIAPLLMAGSICSFPLTYIYRFFVVDREKNMLTKAFAHYVDPRVVAKIGDSAHDIELGGEAKNLTILFSDIAGFTTLSEKLSPSDLFYLMSSYLSRMTSIMTREGGTLDKYIGDAVMGFYGAPLPQEDHAIRACTTALEMRNALPVFNTELLARGLSEIDFRIGIATGDVVVGNIGSHDRFNYTVLGDTVNLASRLEATSKEYGTHILLSEPTYLVTREHFRYRRLDRIAVKGKTEGVMIYELIAKSSDTIDMSVYERYEQGLERYLAGNYLEAGQIWESNISLDPSSKVMAHRCLDILEGRVKVEGGSV